MLGPSTEKSFMLSSDLQESRRIHRASFSVPRLLSPTPSNTGVTLLRVARVCCQAHFEYEISRLLLSCDTFLDERFVPFCLKTQGSHLVCNLLMILAVVCYSDEVQISLAPGAGDCQRTQNDTKSQQADYPRRRRQP